MSSIEVTGVPQTDILIKSAVELGLKELRSNPELIDDVLASLPQDDITADKYGNITITQCKRWFHDTEPEVLLGLKFRYLEKPSVVAIDLGDWNESETTIGDKNYQTSEDHPRKPGVRRAIESLHVDSSYTIAIFSSAEPETMLFLQSLVLYQLCRRKEDLLDKRGFAVSKFSMGSASLLEPESREMIYFRTIKLFGKERVVWGKKEGTIIQDVPVAITPKAIGDTSSSPNNLFLNSNWENMDVLGGALP